MFRSRARTSLLARLRPGVDGVTLEHGGHRATFLPQVWETLRDPRAFLAELKRKAGMAGRFLEPAQLNVGLYEVTKWKESEFLAARELHERQCISWPTQLIAGSYAGR